MVETCPFGVLILGEKPGHPWQRLQGTQGACRMEPQPRPGGGMERAWASLLTGCPGLVFRKPLLGEAEDFTVYIKNFIRFPKFNFSKYVGLCACDSVSDEPPGDAGATLSPALEVGEWLGLAQGLRSETQSGQGESPVTPG